MPTGRQNAYPLSRKNRLTLLLGATLLFGGAEAKTQRSAAAVAEFKRANPCPVTNKARGACPGWQVDHRLPLCVGGADKPENMQWLTVEGAKGAGVELISSRRLNQLRPPAFRAIGARRRRFPLRHRFTAGGREFAHPHT